MPCSSQGAGQGGWAQLELTDTLLQTCEEFLTSFWNDVISSPKVQAKNH